MIGTLPGSQLLAQAAQPGSPKTVAKKPAVKKASTRQDEDLPETEDLIIETSDGVKLACTFFESPNSTNSENGRTVVPIILLHDWNGDRGQLLEFGSFLQAAGHAVIVPDLRGHGDSTQVSGLREPIDATDFRKRDIVSVLKDIERCKKFLVKQHNEGKVNIDLLSVVAVGKTCLLAVQWAMDDWYAFPPYSPKGIKQGQDVKALLLISPEKKLAGISMVASLKHPLFAGTNDPALTLFVMWSANDEMAKDTESIVKTLEKPRPDLSKIKSRAERFEKKTLFSVPVNSQFSGLELMKTERVNGLWQHIERILFTEKVAANADQFPWKSRDSKAR